MVTTGTKVLSSMKQERIVSYAKRASTVLLIFAIVVFDDLIVVDAVTSRWLPILGLVLGICFACLGFVVLAFIRRRCKECGKRIILDSIREKTVLISGFSLLLSGVLIVALNNSMALVFNIHWLDTWGLILGQSLACIGIWFGALFSELFAGDRKLHKSGFLMSGLLLVFVILELGFGL